MNDDLNSRLPSPTTEEIAARHEARLKERHAKIIEETRNTFGSGIIGNFPKGAQMVYWRGGDLKARWKLAEVIALHDKRDDDVRSTIVPRLVRAGRYLQNRPQYQVFVNGPIGNEPCPRCKLPLTKDYSGCGQCGALLCLDCEGGHIQNNCDRNYAL